jgi:hypothetical protein
MSENDQDNLGQGGTGLVVEPAKPKLKKPPMYKVVMLNSICSYLLGSDLNWGRFKSPPAFRINLLRLVKPRSQTTDFKWLVLLHFKPMMWLKNRIVLLKRQKN